MSKKEATALIKLADRYDSPVELAYGSRSIKAEPGKPVELPESEALAWLSTKKFVRVEVEKPAAEEASPIDELMKLNKPALLVKAAELGLADNDHLNKREIAELILKKTEESN